MTNQNNSKKELSVYQGKLNHGVTDFYDRDNPFLLSEIKSVKKYPNLSWAWKNDIPAITGTYFFKSEYKGTVLEDSFRLSITFPQNYPYSLPHAFELDGKIESNYHHFLSDGSLCLGTEIDLYKIFAIRPCLDTFMTEILNPYLYRWLYINRFGKEP